MPQRDYYQFLAFFHGVQHFDNGGGSLRSLASADSQALEADVLRQASSQDRRHRQGDGRDRGATVGRTCRGANATTSSKSRTRSRCSRSTACSSSTPRRWPAIRRSTKRRKRLKRNPPRSDEQALCVTENGGPRDTYILLRGNPQPGRRGRAGLPAVLLAADTPDPVLPKRPKETQSAGRRRVLADWIASPDNPLTARVMVNRVWQYHFGRGIVRSSSNFGYRARRRRTPNCSTGWPASSSPAA